ncbi:nucleotidyltransferase family protein [Phaeobacter marinintestinus]|uniref:nucleotidyltransferase family protein n=1 Tax=Falsiphaeobacter marinintestinus TaxID=1492905 RepID=UPI0011B5B161|nr:nucleotidyltransferase family protein [Phaeobacter marinintestinus]
MSDHPTSVMLFAAGFGTRMRELTQDRPKPMIDVAGRPLIDHALDLARQVHPKQVVANLHYKPDILAAHLEPLGVLLSREEPDILDTGGGLRAALPLLGKGPVFTMNTDAIWAGPNPLDLLRQAWDPARMDALLMCVPVAQTVGRVGAGDFSVDDQGRISRGPDVVYGGVQILKTDALPDFDQPAFSLNLLWNQMEKEGRLFAATYPGRWCDVGHPEGISMAENLLNAANV